MDNLNVWTLIILPSIVSIIYFVIFNIPRRYKSNIIHKFEDFFDGYLLGCAMSLLLLIIPKILILKSIVIISVLYFQILLYTDCIFNRLVYNYVISYHGQGLITGWISVYSGFWFSD